jgi:hypothetical protein
VSGIPVNTPTRSLVHLAMEIFAWFEKEPGEYTKFVEWTARDHNAEALDEASEFDRTALYEKIRTAVTNAKSTAAAIHLLYLMDAPPGYEEVQITAADLPDVIKRMIQGGEEEDTDAS